MIHQHIPPDTNIINHILSWIYGLIICTSFVVKGLPYLQATAAIVGIFGMSINTYFVIKKNIKRNDLDKKISRESFAYRVLCNESGKPSISATVGGYLCFVGGMCFVWGCLEFKFSNSREIMTNSLSLIYAGSTLVLGNKIAGTITDKISLTNNSQTKV